MISGSSTLDCIGLCVYHNDERHHGGASTPPVFGAAVAISEVKRCNVKSGL